MVKHKNGTPYLIKAADLDGNKCIAIADSGLLAEVVARSKTINQVTGIAS